MSTSTSDNAGPTGRVLLIEDEAARAAYARADSNHVISARSESIPIFWTSAMAGFAIESGMVGCPLCYEALDDAVWRHFGITRGNWNSAHVS